MEGDTSHGGSADSPGSAANAGSPLGSLVALGSGSAPADQGLRKSAVSNKRKHEADPSPSELDDFRLSLVREYLREFPAVRTMP